MKITEIIIGAFLTVATSLVVWNYTREIPEVRYVTTSSIKIPAIANNQEEYVSQVELKNSGAGVARNLSIKIPHKLIKYEVRAHTAVAKYQFQDTNDGGELIYQDLPPSQEIKFIFSTRVPIFSHDIQVFHEGGKGIEALKEAGGSGIYGWFSILLPLIYLLIIFQSLYAGREDRSYQRFKWKSLDYLMQASKPILLKAEEWRLLREKVIREWVEADRIYSFKDVPTSKIYSLLSNYSSRITEGIKMEAIEALNFKVRNVAISNRSIDSISDFSLLKKPDAFPDKLWTELSKEMSRCYVFSVFTRKWVYRLSGSDIGARPSFVDDEDWSFLSNAAGFDSFHNLLKRCCAKRSVDEADILEVDGKFREVIELIAKLYSELVKKNDELKHREGFISELVSRGSQFSIDEYVRRTGIEIDAKINSFAGQYIKSVAVLEREAIVRQREADLDRQGIRLNGLINKVTKQLDFIDCLLSDPAQADRIEEYNSDFSLGNFNNLKRVAVILNGGH